MKNIFRIYGIIFLILSILAINYSCKKDKISIPILTTTVVTGLTQTVAMSGGTLTSLGNAGIVTRGVCWNTASNPTIINNKTSESGGLGDFTSFLTQLSPNTKYYVRAYATNSAGTSYGNQVEFTTNQIATDHFLGEIYGGGIIIAVWKQNDTEHGLIASLTDIGTEAVWSNITTEYIGITAQSPVDGQANTNAIIAQPGHIASAAKLCKNYTSGGFSDWYLPASWELNQCYSAALVVNTILGSSNGFKMSVYWSSTESTLMWGAFGLDFSAGNINRYDRNALNSIRAVRRF